jgi:hypothetical protein
VSFTLTDPWALHASFQTDLTNQSSVVDWIFYRVQFAKFLDDMLPSGEGDVRLDVGSWHRDELIDVSLFLRSPEGMWAEVLIDAREIKTFLHRIAQILPIGDSLYSDEEIEEGHAAILASG